MHYTISDRLKHFFHVLSNIRPTVWMLVYLCTIPVFALIYWALPDGQFRIPDGGGTDFGSWLYYSIVTITTLGFGDYTPAHAGAQAVTAIEVGLGLVLMGLFLNAVGSMKSEIDITSELERQKQLHFEEEKRKLLACAPAILHNINAYLAYCWAVTTPLASRTEEDTKFNPGFTIPDMADMFKPSGLNFDTSSMPAVARLMKSAEHTSLSLDTFQTRVDLTLWPDIMDDCFNFVAKYQMFSSEDLFTGHPSKLLPPGTTGTDADAEKELSDSMKAWIGDPATTKAGELHPVVELFYFIKDTAALSRKIETAVTEVADQEDD